MITLPKAVGLLLVFCASLSGGLLRARALRRMLCTEEAFAWLIRFIKNRIETVRSPLPEIYAAVQNGVLEDCGIASRLRSGGWESAVEEAASLCSPACLELLRSFGKGLGKSDAAHQSELCEWHLRQLEAVLEKEREQVKKDARLSVLLGITAGLMAVILFL